MSKCVRTCVGKWVSKCVSMCVSNCVSACVRNIYMTCCGCKIETVYYLWARV